MPTRRLAMTSLVSALAWPRVGLALTPPKTPGPAGLTADKLTWPEATPEQLVFMRRVYIAHIARASRQGRFAGDIPRERLGTVEKDSLLFAPAATACRNLLISARTDLDRLREARDPAVAEVKDIAVLSGYRSASRQFRLWNDAFPGYFAETEPERLTLPGGPMGDAAVKLVMLFVRRHLAAPGTSLHNTGKAVDFQTTEHGEWLIANRAQRAAWRQSWFFTWLSRSGPAFGFHQNMAIDEPWHWEWRS